MTVDAGSWDIFARDMDSIPNRTYRASFFAVPTHAGGGRKRKGRCADGRHCAEAPEQAVGRPTHSTNTMKPKLANKETMETTFLLVFLFSFLFKYGIVFNHLYLI